MFPAKTVEVLQEQNPDIHMLKRTLVYTMSVFAFFVMTVASAAAATTPSAPFIVSPTDGGAVDSQLPVITGLAPEDMRVAVYIDDVFNGYAETVSEANGLQSFKYTPFVALEQGWHTVMTRAEDTVHYVRSERSTYYSFYVEHPLPSPTLLRSTVNSEDGWRSPWIHGVAPSGAMVEVWIDGELNGWATVTEHESGTGSFAYKPFLPLSPGTHIVQTRTVVERPDTTMRTSAVSGSLRVVVAAEDDNEASTATTTSEATNTESQSQENNSESTDTITDVAEEDGDNTEETEGSDDTHSENGDDYDEESNDHNDEEGDDHEDGDEEHSEGGSDDRDEDDKEKDGEQSRGLTILGWAFLIIAAVIFVQQLRHRRKDGESTPEQSQLELTTDSDNNAIEVLSTDEEETSSEDTEKTEAQEETTSPTETASEESTEKKES